MELRHLHYFIVVAEQLHFSRAAEILHIAQPPLSQQIQHLERELGVTLFVRTKRRVQLTPAGKAFLVEAKKVMAQTGHAIEVAQQAQQGLLGRLEIGFVSSAGAEALPSLLKQFRERFPLVEVKLQPLPTTQQVQALHEGQIHVGLLHPPLLNASLALEIIRREPLLVVLPAEHALATQERIALSQLSEEAFILPPRAWNPGTFDQMSSLCRAAGFHHASWSGGGGDAVDHWSGRGGLWGLACAQLLPTLAEYRCRLPPASGSNTNHGSGRCLAPREAHSCRAEFLASGTRDRFP